MSSNLTSISTFYNTATQSIPAGTDTVVLFPTTDANNFGTPNISNSNGTFTNNNTTSVVVHITATISGNNTYQAWVFTPNTNYFSGRSVNSTPTQIATTFPLNAGQSFQILVYAPNAMTIGSNGNPNRINNNSIQIMVCK